MALLLTEIKAVGVEELSLPIQLKGIKNKIIFSRRIFNISILRLKI
jgi:hypothetical protein